MKQRLKRLAACFLVLTVFVTSSHIEAFATENQNVDMQTVSEVTETVVQEEVTEESEPVVQTETTEESESVEQAETTENTCGENLTWSLTEGVLTISGTGAMTNYGSASATPWYESREEITKVIVEDEVTSIGNYAICDLPAVTEVIVGDGVTSIGNYGINSCPALETLVLGAGVTSIGQYGLRGNAAVTELTLPNQSISGGYGWNWDLDPVTVKVRSDATSITQDFLDHSKTTAFEVIDPADETAEACFKADEAGVLYSADGKEILRYPRAKEGAEYEVAAGTETMRDNVFKEVQLEKITLPEGLTNVSNSAFYNSDKITELEIPDSVTSIGDSAIRDMAAIKKVVVGDGVTSIGNYGINSCPSLETLVLGAGVTSIGQYGLRGNAAVTELTLPNQSISGGYGWNWDLDPVTVKVRSDATSITQDFLDCSKTTAFEVIEPADETAEACFKADEVGVLYSADGKEILRYPRAKEGAEYEVAAGTETMRDNVFKEVQLEKVTLPEGLTNVSNSAFYNSDKITELEIPDSVTSIGDSAIRDMAAIKKMVVGDGVTSIANYGINSCPALETLVLGAGVTSIGQYGLRGNAAVTKLTLPNQSISGGYGWNWDLDPVTVKVRSDATSITQDFLDCSKTTAFEVIEPADETAKANYKMDEAGALYSADGKEILRYPRAKEEAEYEVASGTETMRDNAFKEVQLEKVTLPEGLTNVSNSAFYNSDKITELVIPGSVTSIGDSAIRDMAAIKKVVVGDGVTSIANYGISSCPALETLVLGAGVTSIGQYGLRGNAAVTELTLPNQSISGGYGWNWDINPVTVKIRSDATSITQDFLDCSKTTAFEVIEPADETLEAGFKTDEAGVLYSADGKEILRYPRAKEGTEYEVAAGTETMRDNAFKEVQLEKVTLPEGLTNVSNSAFYNSDKITELVIPDSVTCIGDSALRDMAAIKKVVVGDGVTSIANYGMDSCPVLETLVLGAGVTSIGQYGLRGNAAITELTLPNQSISGGYGWNWDLNPVTVKIRSDATSITQDFLDCSKTTAFEVIEPFDETAGTNYKVDEKGVLYSADGKEIVRYPRAKEYASYKILDGTESIAKYAFRNTTNLANVLIPDSVSEIGQSAFEGSTELTSIVIPNSVKTISDYAFCNCTKLKTVQMPTSVTSIGYRVFYGSGEIVIYCEYGSVAAQYAQDNSIEYVTSSNCVTFTLNKQYAVNQGETDNRLSESVKNYLVTVTNNTTGEVLSGYQLNNGSIVLNAGSVTGGDELTICLESKKNETIPLEKTFTLDENGNAFIELETIQKGYVTATVRSKINGCMLIYDAQGDFIEAKEVRNGSYRSTYLEEGNYQVILVQGRVDFWDFDNIAEFTEKGLVENEDYLQKNITVENKYYTDLGEMTLLDLDAEELMYLDMDKCAYISTTTTTQANSLLSLRVEYAFKETRTDEIGDSTVVKIYVPENCEYITNSATIDGVKVENASLNGDYVHVPVTEKEGIIRFTMKPVTIGDFKSNARITFTVNDKTYTENIGSIVMEVPYISLHCPEITTKREMNVYGTAVPGETVAVYDGDVRVGTAISNKAGKWSADITLNGEIDKTNHKITAKLFAGTAEEVCTETKLVYYDTEHVEITQFTMYYNNHRNSKIDLLEYMGGERKRISFNPAYPFTFVVKLSDSSRIKTVRIVSTKVNGSDYMNATYNPDNDTWVASGHFPDHKVPGNLSVSFSENETFKFDPQADNYLMTEEEAALLPEPIQNAEVNIEHNVETSDYSSFSAVIKLDNKENTEVGFTVNTQKVELIDDDTAIEGLPKSARLGSMTTETKQELEQQGFTEIETTDENYDYYVKFEVTENGDVRQEIYKYPKVYNGDPVGEHVVTEITKEAISKIDDIAPLDIGTGAFGYASDVIEYQKKVNSVREVIENSDMSEAERAEKLAKLKKIDDIHTWYNLEKAVVCIITMAAVATGAFIPGLIIGTAMAYVSSQLDPLFDELLLMLLDLELDWLVDPSGYVYEAVPSNRLKGVKATLYFKDEDGNSILWDAEEYGQKNPLYTDSSGIYAWDVPEGQWQVKYELDGYEVGYSEWLPVPPIQLDVNEGMISLKAPEVKMTELYGDYAVITFDKYMKVSAMVADDVLQVIDANGKVIDATLETLDEEKSPENVALARSYKLAFKEEIADGDYTLKVSEVAESYAGVQMEEVFEETLSVKSSIKNVEVAIPEKITTGNTVTIPVTLTQSGNTTYTVTAETSMADIAEVVSVSATDDSGVANITIKANIPGTVELKVAIEGTTIYKMVEISVVAAIEDIETTPVSVLYVETIPDQEYTGEAVTPSVEVIDNGTLLTPGTDYIVTYADNDKPGTATITIEGIGKYKGSRTETFNIVEAKKLATPTLSSIQNTSTGIKFTWKKVEGAEGYIIYRKAGTATKWTKWKKVGNVSSITNTGLTSGKKYTYTVSAYSGDVESKYNTTGKSITYLKRPSVTLTNASTGITVKWSKVTGATGYIVYRKAGTAKSWTKVTTIKKGSTVSYTDKKANTNGKKYQYYVKASKGSVYSANAASVTTYRLSRPTLKTYKNIATRKISLKWTKNTKATGYQIRYQTGSTTKTVKVKGYKNVSKTITKLTKNKTYKVSVRSYKTVSSKTYYSAWSSVKSVKVKK